jgi:hypothetical protein
MVRYLSVPRPVNLYSLSAELLIIAKDIASLSPPKARDYNSLKNYIVKTRPMVEEQEYVRYREDLVCLKPGREYSYVDAIVEDMLFKVRGINWVYVRHLF